MKTFASQVRAALPLLLLLTVAITLGIVLDTAAGSRPGIERRRKGDLLETLLGEIAGQRVAQAGVVIDDEEALVAFIHGAKDNPAGNGRFAQW